MIIGDCAQIFASLVETEHTSEKKVDITGSNHDNSLYVKKVIL